MIGSWRTTERLPFQRATCSRLCMCYFKFQRQASQSCESVLRVSPASQSCESVLLILFLGVFPTFHSSMMFNQERIRRQIQIRKSKIANFKISHGTIWRNSLTFRCTFTLNFFTLKSSGKKLPRTKKLMFTAGVRETGGAPG